MEAQRSKSISIGHLGSSKSFSGQVAAKIAQSDPGQPYSFRPYDSLTKTVTELESGKVDLAVTPINTVNGPIEEVVYPITFSDPLRIQRWMNVPIRFDLGAYPGHCKIEEIWTKQQAWDACVDSLPREYGNAKFVPKSSTDEAVLELSRKKSKNVAVIASEKALSSSGLDNIYQNINPDAITTFILVGRGPCRRTGNDITTLCFDFPANSAFADVKKFLDEAEFTGSGSFHHNYGYQMGLRVRGHELDEGFTSFLEKLKRFVGQNVNIQGCFPNSHEQILLN